MSSIVLTTRSGPDRKLHLEIPVACPDAEFVVEIVVRPNTTGVELPHNYFDRIGSIKDETFVRPPQGELPPPVELG